MLLKSTPNRTLMALLFAAVFGLSAVIASAGQDTLSIVALVAEEAATGCGPDFEAPVDSASTLDFALLATPLLELAGKPKSCIPASQCCKVCGKGKACGNSCISASSSCSKGRGCACNSYEVC